jgi:hypothetical protein
MVVLFFVASTTHTWACFADMLTGFVNTTTTADAYFANLNRRAFILRTYIFVINVSVVCRRIFMTNAVFQAAIGDCFLVIIITVARLLLSMLYADSCTGMAGLHYLGL